MPDIGDKMSSVFGKMPKVNLAPPPPPTPVVKLPPRPKKGLDDITIAIQAQRIYNPALPPAPPTKAPAAPMLEQGSAPAMDLDNSYLGKK